MTALRRLWCTLRGHDRELKVDPGRIYLRCVTCDARSAGWTVGPLHVRTT